MMAEGVRVHISGHLARLWIPAETGRTPATYNSYAAHSTIILY